MAYASGKELLSKVAANQASQEQEKSEAGHKRAGESEDEGMLSEEEVKSTKGESRHHTAGNEMVAEYDPRMKVTISKANELNHAKCILKLTYNKFEWSEEDLNRFHRPNI